MSDTVKGNSPRVAVFDIDGVLADVRHRLHHIESGRRDWDGFFASAPEDPVLADGCQAVRQAVESGLTLIYLTGRPERCRVDTVQWLSAHGLPEGELIMRRDSDRRPARVLKVEALRRIASQAPVAYLVDDDLQVVAAAADAGFAVRLADWVPRQDPLTQAQETLGRT
ncbi:MAG: LNS2 domain-containing protein [Candidatus Nanopelagicales bacterium]